MTLGFSRRDEVSEGGNQTPPNTQKTNLIRS
jgi:hypothetical protein